MPINNRRAPSQEVRYTSRRGNKEEKVDLEPSLNRLWSLKRSGRHVAGMIGLIFPWSGVSCPRCTDRVIRVLFVFMGKFRNKPSSLFLTQATPSVISEGGVQGSRPDKMGKLGLKSRQGWSEGSRRKGSWTPTPSMWGGGISWASFYCWLLFIFHWFYSILLSQCLYKV